ncbi:MAG TPA: cytochrome c-type biogenesis protein CcmH [Gemmatimonadales bacterium]|nr:cytochrome c-type biogenesis protein CcmH [Gemmatimonadales bacterium]
MILRPSLARVAVLALACALLGGVAPLGAQTRDSLAGSGPGGTLWDPNRVGRPLEPITAADNDAAIQVIEKRLRCTCSCNQDVYTCRTTDFSCTTSPTMHRHVQALASRGLIGQQIVDSFVQEDGIAVLMAPPAHGFNLAGYFTPGLVILAAGVLLVLALRRWSGDAAPAPAPAAPADASPEELERLRRELAQFTD